MPTGVAASLVGQLSPRLSTLPPEVYMLSHLGCCLTPSCAPNTPSRTCEKNLNSSSLHCLFKGQHAAPSCRGP